MRNGELSQKNTGYSSRGHGFDSQHQYGGLKLSISPVAPPPGWSSAFSKQNVQTYAKQSYILKVIIIKPSFFLLMKNNQVFFNPRTCEAMKFETSQVHKTNSKPARVTYENRLKNKYMNFKERQTLLHSSARTLWACHKRKITCF